VGASRPVSQFDGAERSFIIAGIDLYAAILTVPGLIMKFLAGCRDMSLDRAAACRAIGGRGAGPQDASPRTGPRELTAADSALSLLGLTFFAGVNVFWPRCGGPAVRYHPGTQLDAAAPAICAAAAADFAVDRLPTDLTGKLARRLFAAGPLDLSDQTKLIRLRRIDATQINAFGADDERIAIDHDCVDTPCLPPWT